MIFGIALALYDNVEMMLLVGVRYQVDAMFTTYVL